MMVIRLLRTSLTLCMLLFTWSMAMAEEEYNPSNPPEPEATYKLSVTATPDGAGYVSGKGYYKAGQSVWINTSANDIDYRFVRWLIDGVEYSTEQYIYFTMPEKDVNLVAEYEYVTFDPDSPEEPSLNFSWRLYVTANPPEAASFNINNGSRFNPEEWIEVYAYMNHGFEFNGWYENGIRLSESLGFNYEMPAEDARLEARFTFNPGSPDEPESAGDQTDIDTGIKGDVNGDGTVDTMDAVALVNYILKDKDYIENMDINKDGDIDAQDITTLVNIFLNSN